MKKIIIGFSKPRDKIFPIFSWLIKLWDRANYSHVYIRWETSLKDKICYQASRSMVHFIGEKVFKRTIIPVYEFEFELSEEKYREMVSFCIKNAGVSYSFLQIIGIALSPIFKKNIFSNGANAFVCSELTAVILKEKMFVTIDKHLELLTPKDIYLVCKKYGKPI
jgi:hypothetical protein